MPPQHKHKGLIGDRAPIVKNLTQSQLPLLKQVDSQKLKRPIQEEELLQAIKDLKPGKSQGPDGFSLQYYKTFTDLLKTPLLQALNSLTETDTIYMAFLQAHIMVFPKPNKDPTDCANYRPISLLNFKITS